jgi:hypothetical protein
VVKVQDNINGNAFVVVGTIAQYQASAKDDGTTAMPLLTTIPTPILLRPADCNRDASGNYVYTIAIPPKVAGDEYKAHVSVDGVQAVAPAAAGHATSALLVTWLNTNYAAAGTWSEAVAGTTLKLVSATRKEIGLTIEVGNYA